MIKYSDKSNLREKGYLAPFWSLSDGGGWIRTQEWEAAVHARSLARLSSVVDPVKITPEQLAPSPSDQLILDVVQLTINTSQHTYHKLGWINQGLIERLRILTFKTS